MTALASRLGAPVRFFLLGGLSFTLNLAITATLHEVFRVGPEAAFAVALVVVFLVNFACMRWWVFRGTRRPLIEQLRGFGLASLLFRGLEYVGYLVLLRALRVPYLLAVILVIGTSFAVKYVVYDSWLFSREKT